MAKTFRKFLFSQNDQILIRENGWLASLVNDSQSLVDLVEQQLSPLVEQYQGVMVACSGHLDSMVLFDVFCEISKRKKNFLKGVIHINYKQRGSDSIRDQALVGTKAKNSEIPFIVENWSGRQEGFSQEAARNFRQTIFQSYIEKGILIALAHHSDDLAENVLFRTARGSSLGNLLGMSAYNEGYFRPFLQVNKSVLHDWAVRRGVEFGIDSTNSENKYSRNLIRNKIIPDLSGIKKEAAENFVARAREAQEWELFILNELSKKVVVKSHTASLLRQELLALPLSIQIQAIRSMFLKLSGMRGNCPRNSLIDFLARVSNATPNQPESMTFPGGHTLETRGSWITLSRLLPVQDQARYLQTLSTLESPPVFRISHQCSSFLATDQNGEKYLSNRGESNFCNMIVLESFN